MEDTQSDEAKKQKEELDQRNKEFADLIEKAEGMFVDPPKKIARKVVQEDVTVVMEQIKLCAAACYVKRGPYPSAFAIAHPQLYDKDPLQLFVFGNGIPIINPKVTRYTKTKVLGREGCMSFPDKPMKNVFRWHKLTLQYDIINPKGELSTAAYPMELKGQEARIVQHELEHLDGRSIYDDNYDIKPLI